VGARRDFRHDSAENAMHILGQDHEGLLCDLIAGARYDSGGCFVTGCLDAED